MWKLNPSSNPYAVNLKYKTTIAVTDCISILKNKNIYDVFEYKFEFIDENIYNITFTKALTHMCGNIRTKYLITFNSEMETTVFYLNFINELYIVPIPCIPELWINEFMKQKLDAISF